MISCAPLCHKVFTGLSTIFRLIRLTAPLNVKRPLFPPTPKNSAFVPQEHQIRMRSDERNKGIHRSAHSRGDGVLVEGLQLAGIKLVFTNRRAYNRDYTVWTRA